jgi:peptide/nickel transport system ATP-binding protein
MAPLLEIRDLDVTYRTMSGDLPAVRGVSLSIAPGQSVGIAGESGCGKSTLASTVLRLQPNNANVDGLVLVDGKDVLDMRWGDLRALRWADASMIFQGALHSLNPVQRIGDQIEEPILLHDASMTKRAAAARIGELLEQVGLPTARARAYPHQLSGGQRQRVMIAMALACRPKLVIADEPTTALDVMIQAQVLNVLTDLVKGLHLGLMLISHDLSVLGTTCDRVVVMYAGRIIEHGQAEEIFDHPQHPYTAALAAAFPRVGDPTARFAPAGLPGDPPDPRELPSGCTFHPRCPVVMMDRCPNIDPPLERAGPDHQAACLLVGTDRARTPQTGSVG